MAILTRDMILASDDLPREHVAVPEWGGDVLVRGMTTRERGELIGGRDTATVDARLVMRCVIDEQGKALFSEADISALAERSAVAMARVAVVAWRLSGLSADSVESAEKN